MSGIFVFEEKVSPRVAQTLRSIERRFSKAVLTNGYAKITRLCGVCATNAAGMSENVERLVAYVTERLEWLLQCQYVVVKDVRNVGRGAPDVGAEADFQLHLQFCGGLEEPRIGAGCCVGGVGDGLGALLLRPQLRAHVRGLS